MLDPLKYFCLFIIWSSLKTLVNLLNVPIYIPRQIYEHRENLWWISMKLQWSRNFKKDLQVEFVA